MKGFFERLFAKPRLDSLLKGRLSKQVALITAEELNKNPSQFILLDSRSRQEYEVSHIAHAIWVDELPDEKLLKILIPEPEAPVVVYCIVGIRSNAVAEKLNDLDYKQVFNLYGGIFEWKNYGFQVVNASGKPTERVHAYSKSWSIYLRNGTPVLN